MKEIVGYRHHDVGNEQNFCGHVLPHGGFFHVHALSPAFWAMLGWLVFSHLANFKVCAALAYEFGHAREGARMSSKYPARAGMGYQRLPLSVLPKLRIPVQSSLVIVLSSD